MPRQRTSEQSSGGGNGRRWTQTLRESLCRTWPQRFGQLLLLVLWPTAQPALGQMTQIGTPLSGFGNSWHECYGVNFGWNLSGGNWGQGSNIVGLLPGGGFTPGSHLQFTQGGWGSAIPPFGGYDPNANARFGFGVQGSQGGFRLGFELGKGSTRTITSTAPSLMFQNGGGGYIASGAWTPFVTGWIPVVGGAPGPAPLDNAVTRAMQSGQLRLDNLGSGSADRAEGQVESAVGPAAASERSTAATATESVAAIRAHKAAQQAALEQEIAEQLANYEQHRAAGRIDLARLALNRAVVLEPDLTRKQRLRALLKSTK